MVDERAQLGKFADDSAPLQLGSHRDPRRQGSCPTRLTGRSPGFPASFFTAFAPGGWPGAWE
jgi:hypothetical protein